MGGQAEPKPCRGEAQKFIHNWFSNPGFLLRLGMHARVDLKCRWTHFLENVCSILTRSMIAPKHLKDTSKLHHTGWGKTFFFMVDKVSGRGSCFVCPTRTGAACELLKQTIKETVKRIFIRLSRELVWMRNCNLD